MTPSFLIDRVPRVATFLLPCFCHQVLIFNPGFPWYLTTTRVVGAVPVLVELAGPDFAPDMEKVRFLPTMFVKYKTTNQNDGFRTKNLISQPYHQL